MLSGLCNQKFSNAYFAQQEMGDGEKMKKVASSKVIMTKDLQTQL
jgi:hypothetical protein